MIKKTLAGLLSLVVISAISVTGAQAAGVTAPATVGGICAKAGALTPIAGKSYTCVKVLSGKLVWVLTSTTTTVKPQISGGGGEGEGGTNEGQGGASAARQATLKKYNTCLVAHGGTAILAPVGAKQGDDGAAPTTSPAKPTVSAAQKAALAACVALAPKVRLRGGGDN